jgi:hypothetical protein
LLQPSSFLVPRFEELEQEGEVAFAVCSGGLGLVLVLASGLARGFGLGPACGDAVRVRLLELSAAFLEALDASLEGDVDVKRGEGSSWGWG